MSIATFGLCVPRDVTCFVLTVLDTINIINGSVAEPGGGQRGHSPPPYAPSKIKPWIRQCSKKRKMSDISLKR